MKLCKLKLLGVNDELIYKSIDDDKGEKAKNEIEIKVYKNYNGYVYLVLKYDEQIRKDWIRGIKLGNVELYADIYNSHKKDKTYDYTFIALKDLYVIYINDIPKNREILNQYDTIKEIVDFEMFY